MNDPIFEPRSNFRCPAIFPHFTSRRGISILIKQCIKEVKEENHQPFPVSLAGLEIQTM
jgi:hypothetical protein